MLIIRTAQKYYRLSAQIQNYRGVRDRRYHRLVESLGRYERQLIFSGFLTVAGAVGSPHQLSAQSDCAAIIQSDQFLVNTETAYAQRQPDVAMDDDGDFVITWSSYYQDGSEYGIYAQRYNAGGIAQGSEFKVNTYTNRNQQHPAIAMDDDGDFVITWSSYYQDGSGFGIYAQRYNAGGIAQGVEFRVNTEVNYNQQHPAIAMDDDGDFVITWSSYYQDGSEYGIYAQRYNAGGIAQGSEFKVNTYTYSPQVLPAIAMDDDGDFVITWYSYQDGSGFGIYAQRYNAGGIAQGSEFKVNTYTYGPQVLPAIAMDDDGDFVITWYSDYQDASGFGIYAQRYNAGGVAQGAEFRVNTETTYNQIRPTIAMDDDGDFVITWYSQNQDGSNYGIYAQRYAASGQQYGGEFILNNCTVGSGRSTRSSLSQSVAMDSDGNIVATWNTLIRSVITKASSLTLDCSDIDEAGIYASMISADCPTIESQISFADPCSCEDLTNCDDRSGASGTYYFADTLRMPATGSMGSGLNIEISAYSDFYIDVPCSNGGTGSVTSPDTTATGTPTIISETTAGSGIYKIPYWRASGVVPSLSVSVGGAAPIVVPTSVFEPACSISTCEVTPSPIPTLSQWGLILLGILLMIFGIVTIQGEYLRSGWHKVSRKA